ncbi:metal-dependent transcriptional regulator [Pseudonocardia ailaonensis]|uniref:Manganese transport regulator n=1 Tax=Pseudonocardia ailaonensis TaxID=367279 RepID=A0ABN2NKF9_9PSEU
MGTLTPAVEDYLKTIFLLCTRGEEVTTGSLAREMSVSSPSVSAMVKRLAEGELVERGRTLTLTDRGEREALRIVRRHRLLETFLVSVLEMSWDEVHEEADQLEHALSTRLEERIDAALGHPTHDPHGDPIPSADGQHDESWAQPLSAAPRGCRFEIQRVSDRRSDALRYLGERGLRPGVVVDVEEFEPYGGPRWVRIDGERVALAPMLAGLVHGRVVS